MNANIVNENRRFMVNLPQASETTILRNQNTLRNLYSKMNNVNTAGTGDYQNQSQMMSNILDMRQSQNAPVKILLKMDH
jgi:hypothetical protein